MGSAVSVRADPEGRSAFEEVNVRWSANAATTFVAGDDVPVMAPFPTSVAVMVCDPAVASVAEKVAWPLTRVEFGGRATPGARSLLVKCTVPA